VLLVDADLMCPSLHTLFGAEPASGLAEALADGTPVEVHGHGEGPAVVWAGKAAADSADLLASARMDALVSEWRARYDFVLLDSPPMLPVPDAAALARLCDRTVLVVRYESTTMRAAQRSCQILRRNLPEHTELEVVMNGVPEKSPDYFAYYGYKGAGYGGRAQ
jgi:Mrp family chromosome partitioning ATPase